MYKLIGAALFLIGAAAGYFCREPVSPYRLDYGRAVINLPISFSEHLNDDLYALGEKYLAEDLAAALAEYGIEARLYAFEDTFSNRNFYEGFEIYMRPGPELRMTDYHDYADEDRVAVLFETIPYELREVKNADIVFTGSLKKDREYRAQGINSHFLPQFTRTEKFYPAPNDDYRTRILYVANQWPDFGVRKTVAYAQKTGVRLAVFGDNWENILTGPYTMWWKKRQIAGDQLKYYYSSADIVLNDTRQDMIDAGFISNRIFDATACKAFVISDYMPEIEEIYGDSVPMYKNEREFKALIDYYLAHPEERREKAERAYQITMARFTADKIIGQMAQIMKQYADNLKGQGNGEK